MKKIVLLACVLLFPGCAVKYPETANLNLQIPVQSSAVYTDSTAYIRGLDTRENPEIIVFKIKDEPVVKITNLNSPEKVVLERLAGGFYEQGLQLLGTVTKPKLLYISEAVSQVTLEVMTSKASLKKKFTRSGTQESVSRPDVSEIEKMLSDQLSSIVDQILVDAELREVIADI